MKWFKAIFSLIISVLIFWGLNYQHGIIPPMGKVLNPFAGFWQNNTKCDKISGHLNIPGLRQSVTVIWDDRLVPHIFAQNDIDLYFAQGYITARHRLWQMEMQTFAAAGRLSEILGDQMLEYDRYQRRLGMVYGAENALKGFQQNPELVESIAAYTKGVNAYINQLSSKEFPVEYKLLDYKPEAWTELKVGLLLKMMAWDLTGHFNEKQMTAAWNGLSENRFNSLFPYFNPLAEPIIPTGTKYNFDVKMPAEPSSIGNYTVSGNNDENDRFIKGSNNWAVSGTKTQSGFPILCNDPHLALTLPSIWYEIQLYSPNINTYGVSLPGSPSVIIGFNDHIAWGVTNAASDVLDWYDITFKDKTCNEYLFEGEYRKTKMRLEEIKIRGGKAVVDTVFYTHHGPVVYRKGEKPFKSTVPQGAAMRWMAHDVSNEALTFYLLNRAKNYDEYVKALSHYACPGQNFAFADKNGDIAIWHNGRFPLRAKGQGRFIMDGSRSENDWSGQIPHEHNPHIKNPQRGFVSSANQNPVDEKYPYYLGWNYAPFERGKRINEILASMGDISSDDMAKMQNDDVSLFAEMVLPVLLGQIPQNDLTKEEKELLAILQAWDFRYDADSVAPIIFYRWQRHLVAFARKNKLGGLPSPNRDLLADAIVGFLTNPQKLQNFYGKMSMGTIALITFKAVSKTLFADYGDKGEKWKWGSARGTNIGHLGKIPGFGRMNLPTSGNSDNINAITKTHGPSWRMVVELGPSVRAKGIYPGGQSGNPGSKYYDNMVDDWVEGNIYDILFLESPEIRDTRIVGKTIMGENE